MTVDYDTAKAILIEGNPQAGMQAFMAGKVRVEGDMAKLMALQATPAASDPNAADLATRLARHHRVAGTPPPQLRRVRHQLRGTAPARGSGRMKARTPRPARPCRRPPRTGR